jgi:hypothetical protein
MSLIFGCHSTLSRILLDLCKKFLKKFVVLVSSCQECLLAYCVYRFITEYIVACLMDFGPLGSGSNFYMRIFER